MVCNKEYIKQDMFVYLLQINDNNNVYKPYCLMATLEESAPKIYNRLGLNLKELHGLFCFKKISYFKHDLIVLN